MPIVFTENDNNYPKADADIIFDIEKKVCKVNFRYSNVILRIVNVCYLPYYVCVLLQYKNAYAFEQIENK